MATNQLANNPFNTDAPSPDQYGDLPSYSPVQIGDPSKQLTGEISDLGYTAHQPTSTFTDQANAHLDQSNLLGPSNDSDPMSQALSQKASNAYRSQINNMSITAQAGATSRQLGLQANDINNKAALFANEQQRAQLNYQQVAFQRQAAITLAGQTQQLYSQLFGGAATAGGAVAGAVWGSMPGPNEPSQGPAFTTPQAPAAMQPGAMTLPASNDPRSYFA